ncbi:DUF6182 family protein [Frankia sp. CiP1_Cm_nod2]|uniref:DUF6182 family protein n=1 Tax=Frankia sp. CiP1_Cm_nod2 TaxID=2897161 RepID=UPI002024C4C4
MTGDAPPAGDVQALLRARAAARFRAARPDLAPRFDLDSITGLLAAREAVRTAPDDPPVRAVAVLGRLDLAAWTRAACEFLLALPSDQAAAWQRSLTMTIFLAGSPANLRERFTFDHVAGPYAWRGPAPAAAHTGLCRLLRTFEASRPLATDQAVRRIDLPQGPDAAPRPCRELLVEIATARVPASRALVHLHHLLADAVLGGRIGPGDRLTLRPVPHIAATDRSILALRIDLDQPGGSDDSDDSGWSGRPGQPGRPDQPRLRAYAALRPPAPPAAAPSFDGVLTRDDASLRWAADDFGHLVHHRPRAVLRAASVSDVVRAVRLALDMGCTLTARGRGHSVYGQAQAADGLVVDMSGLNRVDGVTASTIRAQAGARWADVVDAALGRSRAVPVLTDVVDTSVGGTLSVGGIGGASHRHGLQIDNVAELSVVTGTGQLLTCSPTRDRSLFHGVLGGLGQCSLIVAATLRTVPAPRRVRYGLRAHHSLDRCLAVLRRLAADDGPDFLQGHVLLAASGRWQYAVETAVYEYGPRSDHDHAPGTATGSAAGTGTGTGRQAEARSYRDFVHRMAPAEAAARASGEWFQPHAWLTVLMPDATVSTLAASVFGGPAPRGLTGPAEPRLVGLLFPIHPGNADGSPTPIPMPAGPGPVWVLSVLRGGRADDPAGAAALVEANRATRDAAVALGGTVYPINAVPTQPDYWRAHFGQQWPGRQALRARFDPAAILTPGYGIPRDDA